MAPALPPAAGAGAPVGAQPAQSAPAVSIAAAPTTTSAQAGSAGVLLPQPTVRLLRFTAPICEQGHSGSGVCHCTVCRSLPQGFINVLEELMLIQTCFMRAGGGSSSDAGTGIGVDSPADASQGVAGSGSGQAGQQGQGGHSGVGSVAGGFVAGTGIGAASPDGMVSAASLQVTTLVVPFEQ